MLSNINLPSTKAPCAGLIMPESSQPSCKNLSDNLIRHICTRYKSKIGDSRGIGECFVLGMRVTTLWLTCLSIVPDTKNSLTASHPSCPTVPQFSLKKAEEKAEN
ncbi:unnamed protein product [Cuscuta epithymum]|uniref:Uncharacterized protein n=1 Tax=Cuscuta epithymum TaxID=186058 RepID=A0AAV0C426_9ASTE|nr:unnamed protein product [Cuscuta epithymum]